MLRDLFASHVGKRIITTCFASHVHRVQQIADAALSQDRTIATMGMSMKKNVRLARQMGLLHIPDNRLVDIDDIGDLDPAEVCIISTGSQGEPMSALALMAADENRWIKVGPGDVVIMSSHPIPGNESNVSKVIDGLVRVGVEVVHSGIEDVHATGHAKQEELKTFHSIARPEWFVPVHGEYRHMVAHARIAHQMGMPADRVLVCEDGDQLRLTDDGLVPHARVSRPATSTSTASSATSATACCAIAACWPRRASSSWSWRSTSRPAAIITGPEVITRGWVYEAEAEGLLDQCEAAVTDAIKDAFAARRDRSREPAAVRAPRRRQVRQRADPPATHDRPGRDGGLTMDRIESGTRLIVYVDPGVSDQDAHERVAAARGTPGTRADRHRARDRRSDAGRRRGARVQPHLRHRPGRAHRRATSASG